MSRIALIAAGLIAISLVYATTRFGSARASDRTTAAQATLLRQQAQRFAEDLALASGLSAASADEGDRLHERIAGSLRDAGLPPTVFAGSTPLGEQPLPGSQGTALRLIGLRLSGIASAELGTWWRAFSRQAGAWRITDCQLQHAPGGHSDADRYDVSLTIALPVAQ